MAREQVPLRPLSAGERVYYRDELRAARYAALADSESFTEICFVIEALGLRLLGRQDAMREYKERIGMCAQISPLFKDLPQLFPATFKTFDALYRTVRQARNDAMHTGAYARHATEAAIELCIGLEEALMMNSKLEVGDVMVKSPITVDPWQPVAHARQLMLMHSFSFLPVNLGNSWRLISELGLARYLNVNVNQKVERLGKSIADANSDGMELKDVRPEAILRATDSIDKALAGVPGQDGPTLWLVVETHRVDGKEQTRLAGVLSPFELM
ncbi:hypothetical protein [Burkholderia gladioli]|uniref:hypothetical protein n=1 Tax=Burkholderia gladioli TaxID=28095 RepID=UPI00163F2A7A|nr:hypothetical protein [Burkholderia gladioli]